MKKSGKEKRIEISMAFYVFGVLLVYFSFWHLSAKGCRQNVWPSCLLFSCLYFSVLSLFSLLSLCVSFPCRFLSVSSSLFLIHAILFEYFCIFLHVCFTWSFCYSLYYCLPLFFCLCPFAFLFLFVSFITLKHRNSKKQCLHLKNLFRKSV